MEPYYPVNKEKNVYFKGRLGEYKYYDMDDVILSALEFANRSIEK